MMGLPQQSTNVQQWTYDGKRGVYPSNGLGGYGGDSYGVLNGLSPGSMGYPQQQGMPVEEDRYGGFEESPAYKFAYDNAMKGAERAASAGGYVPTANGGQSGRFSKEMARYSYGLGSQEWAAEFNRLGVLSGTGQTATNNSIIAGQNYGTNAGNAILAGGDARASGIMGESNAWSGAIEGVASAFGDYLKSRQQQQGAKT